MESGSALYQKYNQLRLTAEVGRQSPLNTPASTVFASDACSVNAPGREVPLTGSYYKRPPAEVFPFAHLCSAQGERRVQDDFKPLSTKQVHCNTRFQAAQPQYTAEDHSPEVLVGQTGSYRRLSAHTYCKKPPEVSGVHVPAKAVFLPCTTIRPLFGAVRFHPSAAVPPSTTKAEGGQYDSLPGRSDLLGTIQMGGKASFANCQKNLHKARISTEPQKVSNKTIARHGLARFLLEHEELLMEFTKVLAKKVTTRGGQDPGGSLSLPKTVGKATGSYGVCSTSITPREVSRTCTPEIHKDDGGEKEGSSFFGLTKTTYRDPVVDGWEKFEPGGSHQGCPAYNSDFHRRLKLWVWRAGWFRKIYSRKLVRSSYWLAYKLQRTVGFRIGTGVRVSSKKRVSCSVHRQQDYILRYQKQRIKQIARYSGVHRKSIAGLDVQKHQRVPRLSSGKSQCVGRRTLQGHSHSDRMEPVSPMFSGFDSQDRLDPRGRFNGNSWKHKATQICGSLSGEGSSRNGLLCYGPDQVEEDIHISPPRVAAKDLSQSSTVRREGSADSSVVTHSTLVSNAKGQSNAVSSAGGTPVSDCTRGEDNDAINQVLSLTRVGTLEKAYIGIYGEDVGKRLVTAVRTSTSDNYERCWKVFQNFLREKQFKSLGPEVVLTFLEFLFAEKHLAPKTISGYKAAIAEPLEIAFKMEIPDETVSRLLRAQFLAKPLVRKRIPEWDVTVVLRRLAMPDFHSETSSIENLLTKTMFLVALATGNRAGELAAIDRKAVSFNSGRGRLQLPVKPNFFYKNQTMNRSPPNIEITKFDDVEPQLCPVACVQHYIQRTQGCAEGDALFLHPVSNRNLQRPSMALKLTKMIQEACPGSIPLMHDIRKQAASIAWTRGLSPGEIVNSVFWSSSNVFIKHYLFRVNDPSLNCVVLNRCQ